MVRNKDLFSACAANYARYRPQYPRELFSFLSSLCREHLCAWDAASGNGQAALMLVPHFKNVIATDLSEQQIAHAIKNEKINYYVATAENSLLMQDSVDLITVAQAFHWFNHETFAKEITRVIKDGGCLAVWCYDLAVISPEVDAIIKTLYRDILGEYWEPERKLVETHYRSITLPFQELNCPTFLMVCEWTFDELIGYLHTWSALHKFIQKNNSDPLCDLIPSLKAAFGESLLRRISWHLQPRVWRILHTA